MKLLKRILYYVWLVVYAFPSTLLGLLVALVMLITGHKPFMFGPTIVFSFKGNGNFGFNLGFFVFTSKDGKDSYSLLAHEYGHSLQALILGPLWLFVIALPSVIRFYYRRLYRKIKGNIAFRSLPSYDAVWFEGTATKYGEKYSLKSWLK